MYVFIQTGQESLTNLHGRLQHPTGEAPQGKNWPHTGFKALGQVELPTSKVEGEQMRRDRFLKRNLDLFFCRVNGKIKKVQRFSNLYET